MSAAAWPVLPLKRLLRPVSPGAVAIKGSLADLDESEGYPAYSASGQDVRVEVPQFSTDGIVLSAVGAQCGKCFHARGAWSVVANTQPFLPTEKADARFMFYVVNQPNFWEIGGSAQPYVQVPRTLPKPVPVPSLDTQKHIAAFLDQKTAQIDALIAKKQALLERLAEKRQEIITKAVTKGLNPAAALRDSGIDWLGQIPAHWQVKRLKFGVSKIGSGVTPRGGATVYVDDGVMLLRSQNVHFDGLRLDDVAFIEPEIDREMAATRVQPYDVLLNITGASIGRCCVYDRVALRANVNQHVCIVRPTSDLSAGFLALMLASPIGQLQIDLSQNGASREGLTFSDLAGFFVPQPSRQEQDEIAAHVDRMIQSLKLQVSKIESSIASLREYRAVLITSAVTGQIEGLR